MGPAAEDLGFSLANGAARLPLVPDHAAVSTGAGRRRARLVGHHHCDGERPARTREQAFALKTVASGGNFASPTLYLCGRSSRTNRTRTFLDDLMFQFSRGLHSLFLILLLPVLALMAGCQNAKYAGYEPTSRSFSEDPDMNQ